MIYNYNIVSNNWIWLFPTNDSTTGTTHLGTSFSEELRPISQFLSNLYWQPVNPFSRHYIIQCILLLACYLRKQNMKGSKHLEWERDRWPFRKVNAGLIENDDVAWLKVTQEVGDRVRRKWGAHHQQKIAVFTDCLDLIHLLRAHSLVVEHYVRLYDALGRRDKDLYSAGTIRHCPLPVVVVQEFFRSNFFTIQTNTTGK